MLLPNWCTIIMGSLEILEGTSRWGGVGGEGEGDVQNQLNWKFHSIVVSTGYQTTNRSMNKGRIGVLWHGSGMEKIEDHGYENLFLSNHKNKQVRYSF